VCRQCLEKLLAGTINGVRCPFCSRVSRMSSFSQLADNLTVLKILDWISSCTTALMCKSCRNRLPRQYCLDCGTVLCDLCKSEGHLQQGHAVQAIQVASEQRRKDLGGTLASLHKAMDHIQQKKVSIDSVTKNMRVKSQAVQQEYARAELRLLEELGH
jgi:tripartite motif-containing protein 32